MEEWGRGVWRWIMCMIYLPPPSVFAHRLLSPLPSCSSYFPTSFLFFIHLPFFPSLSLYVSKLKHASSFSVGHQCLVRMWFSADRKCRQGWMEGGTEEGRKKGRKRVATCWGAVLSASAEIAYLAGNQRLPSLYYDTETTSFFYEFLKCHFYYIDLKTEQKIEFCICRFTCFTSSISTDRPFRQPVILEFQITLWLAKLKSFLPWTLGGKRTWTLWLLTSG